MDIEKYQDEEVIRKVLRKSKTIAVYGASEKPWRASNSITRFLLSVGYDVIPVNPHYEIVMGMKSFPSLLDIGVNVDLIDVFRRSSEVISVAEEAVKIGAKGIWFQEGVINEQAAEIAVSGGLEVVMDKCILKEYNRYTD
ncbi:MAG: CoA-binding protein [Candidatus Marinimicrobia bacterium]|nr:CoA-binding protein [Candidatus Neomarinimicrobiota bacterium]